MIRGRGGFLVCFALAVQGCELSDVVLAPSDDLLIAEVFVESDGAAGKAYAFLHRTLGSEGQGEVSGATVTLTGAGESVTLPEAEGAEACLLASTLPLITGSCYRLEALPEGLADPGERLTLRVETLEGDLLTGATTIPGDFALRTPGPDVTECSLSPDTNFEVRWSESADTWAYVGDVLVEGLAEVIAREGLDATLDEDPLHLIGLAISSADTTLAFPSEFGVFDRFDLDRDIALLLQAGLPSGTRASVTIAAADRNYVNWVRGGSFNPSGGIRIPSLEGEGSGVIGSVVARRFTVVAESQSEIPRCGPAIP
jgi:hypothetical protein